jgi:uncharacterized protein GlcG (DUF336 family)
MSVLDWGGNLTESHAMEGAAANAIDTALLKAKSALCWRRPTSEMYSLSAKSLAEARNHRLGTVREAIGQTASVRWQGR